MCNMVLFERIKDFSSANTESSLLGTLQRREDTIMIDVPHYKMLEVRERQLLTPVLSEHRDFKVGSVSVLRCWVIYG
jgi:hypothetical protein